ncbi:MAG: DUF1285 domain-containing protein [Pseudomonadota bacterium]|nr:DUF1285 domain-containing protein [Pseudomonadota bacterium]
MPNISLGSLERALSKRNSKTPPSNIMTDSPQMCGDIDIRITSDGTWFYMGSPFTRQRLVKLFASVLRRDEVGDYWLVTPAEMCRIKVDDAPFTAVELKVQGSGHQQELKFRTNIDNYVIAGSKRPIRVPVNERTGEPRPYVKVNDELEALIVRSVFYELVELAEPQELNGERVLGVWSKETFFPIGSANNG